jgi:hypothetical protein
MPLFNHPRRRKLRTIVTDTEPTLEPTDAQIRGQMLSWWKIKFRNWGGDSLNEAVMGLVDGDIPLTEGDGEEQKIYDRACELLEGARITIEWGAPDAEVELPEWAQDDED